LTGAIALGLVLARAGLAQTVEVPADIQGGLVFKLLTYDRSFAARAGTVARTVIIEKRDGTRSRLAAESFKSALAGLGKVGGLPQEVRVVTYENAAALAKACRADHVSVVYVTPDFDDEIPAIQHALGGVDVLSVSAVPEYVPRGVVLGFELVSGKPKILLNLAQAKQQNVDFGAEVLRLMKVYR
jgi:hypothetical protein